MKAVNLWKTLFCAALAITAFSACSDDDKDDDGGTPSITVNGEGSVTVAVKLDGGTTDAIEVVSSGNWALTFDDETANWCHPSKETGGKGKTSLTFTVDKWEGAASTAERQVTATLLTNGTFEGISIPKKAYITVKQNGDGSTTVVTNVKEIRTKLAALAPADGSAVDITEDLTLTGIIITDVAAGGISGNQNAIITDNTTEPGSGLIVRFPSAYTFPVGQVVSGSIKGAKTSSKYGLQVELTSSVTLKAVEGSTVKVEPIEVTIADLAKYEAQYVKVNNVQPSSTAIGKFYLPANTSNYATTDFVATNGSGSFQISVYKTNNWAETIAVPKNSGFVCGIVSVFQGTGQVAPRNKTDIEGLNQAYQEASYTKVTINNLAAGNYEVDATIVGVHSKGVMFADNAGGQNNYVLAFNNDWTTQTSNPYKDNVDYSATVKGTVKDQYGLWQFTAPDITVGSKTTFDLGTPATFDAAAIQAYAAAIKADESASEYKYVKLSGTLTIKAEAAYNSYTLAVPGLSDELVKTVTMAYGFDSYYTGIVTGNVVDVEGFALGFDTSKGNLNIMVTKVTKNTTEPAVIITTEPATFAATSPVEQTLSYTVANTTPAEVSFAIEGTNADKFTVVSKTDANVVVKANGNNETDAAYTANLVAKIAGAEKASVELKQAAPSSGEDTKGIFTWMSGLYTDGQYDSKTDFWYFNSKVKPNGGEEVPILRLGKSKFSGVYTTPALGVTGNKKLSFYAVGWTGAPSTVYVRVNGGGSISGSPVSIAANSGYSGNPPFTITLTDSDYYTMELKDLTAASTLTISTSPDFAGAGDSANKSRAAIIGLQIY